MNRSRSCPIDDWVSQSSNWQHETTIRWPPNPSGNIVGHTMDVGKLSQTNPSLRGQRTTVDENHSLHTRTSLLDGKFRGDIGGEFLSTTRAVRADGQLQHSYGEGVFFSNWVRNEYYGPIFAIDPRTVVIPTPSLRSLAGIGTTAIARCKPTNNVANLATGFAEIYRDGLPKLMGASFWKGKTSRAHSAGGEYLNSEFGWKPLVSDIRDASYAAANAHKILESYERNSGKMVRRRYEYPVEMTEVTESVGESDGFSFATQLTAMIDASKPKPVLYKTTRFYRRTWFSGAFTYHLPIGYNSRNRIVSAAAKAGPLLGIELTPEVVWNAAPWTWALDWCSNAGDVISNLSDWTVDGLVMKYGYMMEHSVSSITYTLAGPCRYKPYGTLFAAPVISWFETKRRVKATPFGFETTWNALSARQLAITAALGITRVFS